MNVLSRLGALVIRSSTLVDRGYNLFDRLRSRVVLAAAGSRLLDDYNDLAYGRTPHYKAGSRHFRGKLFHWEEEILRTHFPPAPARILVGGAGGGREPLALAEFGYTVVAFEPSPRLLESLVAATPAGGRVLPFRARYEDLPALVSPADGTTVALDVLGPFDIAIFGWTSFSHIRTEARRIAALEQFARVCAGPILISFFPSPDATPHDRFSTNIGYYHQSTAEEIRETAARARLTVRTLSMDDMDGRWPFAILGRAEGGTPQE